MCDTLGFISSGRAVFGKNSDRSPNEPQVLEFYPAAEHAEGEVIKATYVTVPQVRRTHAVFLSRPTWLWGAEIGVNDRGVCIGNEAVWTLGKYGSTGLTGMDMLRLALERSDSAFEALGVLTSVLEEYGQGGSCGFDHDFYYDNSFLVMDRSELYVLETAGREWAYKKYSSASISNRLSIGADGESYSEGACNFSLRHTEHLYNLASGSANRRKMTTCALSSAQSVSDVMAALRQHAPGAEPFLKGSVGSPCMHFGGLVGDHTTSSFIADLQPDRTVIWATGCSCPCVSLYKPMLFGTEANEAVKLGESYWRRREQFSRALVGKSIPAEYYAERDLLEEKWLRELDAGDNEVFSRCFEEEKSFIDKWSSFGFEQARVSSGFSGRWAKKNAAL